MNKNYPLIVSGILFGLVSLIHLLRLYSHWPIIVAGHHISMTVSMVGFVIMLLLSIWMFMAARS